MPQGKVSIMRIVLLACLLALSASPAHAQFFSSSDPTVTDEDDPIVITGKKRDCRMERRTGSLVLKRVCRSNNPETARVEEFARQDALNRLDYLKTQQDLAAKRRMGH